MAGMSTSKILELSEFDISFDRMASKYQKKLFEETLAEINKILKIVDLDPKKAIDRIISFLKKIQITRYSRTISVQHIQEPVIMKKQNW